MDQDIVKPEEKAKGSDVRPFVFFNKTLALKLLADHPNSITEVCRLLGSDRTTWYWHLSHDPDFAIRVQEIREACCDELESTLFELGRKQSPLTFNDRIAYLRAHRPHLYNPTKRIIVEGYRMGDGEAKERTNRLAGAIDAQIVNAYADRKERKRMRLEGRPEVVSGKEEAGGDGGKDKP